MSPNNIFASLLKINFLKSSSLAVQAQCQGFCIHNCILRLKVLPFHSLVEEESSRMDANHTAGVCFEVRRASQGKSKKAKGKSKKAGSDPKVMLYQLPPALAGGSVQQKANRL